MTTPDPVGERSDAAVNPLSGKPGTPQWLQTKVRNQATRIKRLEAILAASRNQRLAQMYVDLRGAYSRLVQNTEYREKAYAKGYERGFLDGIDVARRCPDMDLRP